MFPLSFYLYTLDTEEERDKLALIYEKYLAAMTATARKYVVQYQSEEDVVHNAIMKVIDYLDKINIDDPIAARSFICAIVHSCAIDWLRKEKKQNTENLDDIEFSIESTDPPPLEKVMSEAGYDYIVKCIRSMSDKYREVCELKFINGMKEREIAKLLGLTEKNVSVRIFRGRQMLSTRLEGYYK